MVAKNMCTCKQNRAGSVIRGVPLSASGKPVLAQDTGHVNSYTTSNWILFATPSLMALCGIDELSQLYQHARAARDSAVDYFDLGPSSR